MRRRRRRFQAISIGIEALRERYDPKRDHETHEIRHPHLKIAAYNHTMDSRPSSASSLSSLELESPHPRQPFTPPSTASDSAIDLDDVPSCYSNGGLRPTPATKLRKRHALPLLQAEQENLASLLRRGIVEHQLGLSVNLMLLTCLTYVCFPSLRNTTAAFFWLSYPSSTTPGMYAPGPGDLYLVVTFVVLFTGVRAFCLDYLLMPLAARCGIAKRKDRTRFAEQSYMMTYYFTYLSWGVYLFASATPSSVANLDDLLLSLWTDFPRLTLTAGMKTYYLSQLAFWLQQIAVIHIEAPRKDHMQMLVHHIITVTLLSGSYPYRQWRVGNAVLVCMDLVDFIFPLAKILRYLDQQLACDIMFGAFVISWLWSRHICYLAICWSLYAHVSKATMPYGTYSLSTGLLLHPHVPGSEDPKILDTLLQPLLHPSATSIAFFPAIRGLFLGLLLALQCITIAWFFMICRVVTRVLKGGNAEDTRSDGEEDGEGEDEESALDFHSDEKLTSEVAGLARDVAVDISHASSMPTQRHEEEAVERYIEIEASSASEDYTASPSRRNGGGGGSSNSSSESSTTPASTPGSASSGKRKAKPGLVGGISSGLHLGEHKGVLNRIGCLSEEQLARERERKREG